MSGTVVDYYREGKIELLGKKNLFHFEFVWHNKPLIE
jgi:hypothetical protein